MTVTLTPRQVYDAIYAALPLSTSAAHEHWPSGEWRMSVQYNGLTSELSKREVFSALYKYVSAKTERTASSGVHVCRMSGEWWFEIAVSDAPRSTP